MLSEIKHTFSSSYCLLKRTHTSKTGSPELNRNLGKYNFETLKNGINSQLSPTWQAYQSLGKSFIKPHALPSPPSKKKKGWISVIFHMIYKYVWKKEMMPVSKRMQTLNDSIVPSD
jgi:hypothetical protein